MTEHMAEITFTKVLGYLFGIPATVMGLLLIFMGALINTTFLIAGFALALAGLLSLPIVRSVVKQRTDVSFSTGAVVGITLLLVTFSMGGVVVGLLTYGGDSSGEDGYTGPGADVSNVSIQAEDTNPNEPAHSLEVTWNARAQSAVDPDPDDMSIYNAEDGQKFLAVRMQLTNTDSESIDLSPYFFRAVVEGVEYQPQSLLGSSQGGLSQVTLRSGASYDGWVVFSVPEDATAAEITVVQDSYYFDGPASVKFNHDESMAIEVAD